jgi:hypothetical protein
VRKKPRTFKLAELDFELLRRVREECGVPMAEALREAIRVYVPRLLEQCRKREGREGA